MAQQLSPFSLIDPTIAGDQIGIDRQRALAQMLLEKGNQDIQPQVAGGYVVPISPWQNLAKMAMMGAGGYANAKSDQMQRDLVMRQSKMLIDALRGNSPILGNSPGVDSSTALGTGAAQGDVGPTVTNAARMGDSGNSGSGNSFFNVGNLLRGQAVSAIGGEPAASAYWDSFKSPDFVKMLRSAGIDENSATGRQLLQANIDKQNYVAPTRLGEGAYNDPKLGVQGLPSKAPDGFINQRNPQTGQWETVPVSGGLNAVTQSVGATKSGEMPFSAQLMDIPIYLPGGDQVTVKLNAVQAKQYNTTGQLPPEIAASIPGLNQGQQPAGAPVNNPGNLRPIGASTGFQQFKTPQEGLAALDNNLQSYGKQGVNTLEGIISKWAPPTENNTQAYIADVSQRLGVDPKQPLDLSNPAVRQAIGTGIMIHEQGAKNLFSSPQAGQRPVVGRTQSQSEQITQQRQEAGGKAVDEQFAKDYVGFTTGGAQDATKQLAQLQDTLTALKTPGADLTGPIIGKTPDAILNVVNPQSIAMRERVEEVVQRSLRAILGAQFTEKEGERLIARAYNPNQPESENAIRVQRLYTQLQGALQSKQDAAAYFQKNGTLQGWQGKLPSMSDFDPSVGQTSQSLRTPAPAGWSIKKIR